MVLELQDDLQNDLQNNIKKRPPKNVIFAIFGSQGESPRGGQEVPPGGSQGVLFEVVFEVILRPFWTYIPISPTYLHIYIPICLYTYLTYLPIYSKSIPIS